jgi:hypothetical protein
VASLQGARDEKQEVSKMKCESCDKQSVACTSEWINDEAMKVLYWCAEHAPVDAEWFVSRWDNITEWFASLSIEWQTNNDPTEDE